MPQQMCTGNSQTNPQNRRIDLKIWKSVYLLNYVWIIWTFNFFSTSRSKMPMNLNIVFELSFNLYTLSDLCCIFVNKLV